MMLEAALLLLNGYAVGKLAVLRLFEPFVRSGPNVLIIFLIPTITALVYLLLVRAGEARRERLGFWLVACSTLFLALVLASRQLAYRSVEALPLTDNDGAVQSREAARFLLDGVNPYAADFSSTPFRIFPSPVGPGVDNLAVVHYAYLPLQFLLMVPTILINDLFDTDFDTQLLLLLIFFGFSAIVAAAPSTWPLRTRLLILGGGNAWFLFLSLAGFNDIVHVTFLTAASLLMVKKRLLLGAAMVGLALASKQTAWLTIPLWVAYWRCSPASPPRHWWKPLMVAGLVAAIIILPFFIWSPGAFFDDTVRYVSGSIPNTYPLSGTTILQYLRTSGFIDSPWTQATTWPLQLLVWAACTWLGIRAVRHQPRPSIVLRWSIIGLLAVTLLSRFAPDNYFLAITELLIAAYGISLAEHAQGDRSNV